MARTVHLFISHSWSYSDNYGGLVDLLENRGYFSFINHSVPKDDPIHNARNESLLYEAIKGKVRLAQVVIILAGVYASYSKWIDKEIQIAKTDFDKPVLAVEYLGAERTSTLVKANADKIVKWRADSVVDAIRDLIDGK